MTGTAVSTGPRRGDAIDIRTEGAEWPRRIDGRLPTALVREAVIAALAACAPGQPVEIGVLLTDDATVHALNRDYRRRDAPTNVLAFAVHEDGPAGFRDAPGPLPLGDVVIAGGVCRAEAAAEGKRLADHLRHLAVHGTLHLLGHDHEIAADADRMENLEREVLVPLGIADPYATASAV